MTPVSNQPSIETALAALAGGYNRDPFAVLGPHRDEAGATVVIRAVHPAAESVAVRLLPSGELHPMARRSDGTFEARLDAADIPDYRLRVAYPGGHVGDIDDPYRYGRVLTDFDLHLFAEGTHYRAYEKLGAHRIQLGVTSGVHFAD